MTTDIAHTSDQLQKNFSLYRFVVCQERNKNKLETSPQYMVLCINNIILYTQAN